MQALLNEFPGLRVFGIEDESTGKLLVNEGLVFIYNNHIIVIDPNKHIVEDRGVYVGTMPLEEAVEDIWTECFESEEQYL